MGSGINMLNPAVNTQRLLTGALANLQKKQAQLASGQSINQAADDAAGLQIADTFRSQILQNTQEASNLQTGVSMVQTADAALGTQQEVVGRLQELATQAANGTLTTDQRNALNQEAQTLLGQIDNTAQNTEFNGTKLLNGTTSTVALGTQGGEQVALNSSTTSALNINGLDLTTQEGAKAALDRLGTAANTIDQNRASLGAQQNRFSAAIETRNTANQNIESAQSLIRDTDYANAAVERTKNQMQILQSAFAQTQGNVTNQTVAKLLGVQ